MLTYADEFLESQVYVMQAEHSVCVCVCFCVCLCLSVSVSVSLFVGVGVGVGVAWAWACVCVCVCVYARDLVMALSGACHAARMTTKLIIYYIYIYIIYIYTYICMYIFERLSNGSRRCMSFGDD
jgi:hypothetical protein